MPVSFWRLSYFTLLMSKKPVYAKLLLTIRLASKHGNSGMT